ncbi:MAG: bi-domain-containing oxidoreductase [SAR324 cluster bacterium]|nr:bi-domain-containing oxidoreductase [SAR324 cluster bacterium]
MKQIMQNYKTGTLSVEDVPAPGVKNGHVLVQTQFSLISAGTEKTKVDTARMNLLQKAKARPDQVEQVLTNLHQEGVIPTVKKVFNKLDTPVSLGYSSMGKILAVGAGVEHMKVGDRVACAGEGYAAHAEIVCTPAAMCNLVPDNVPGEHASFGAVGAIALQAVRLAQIELGYRVGVIGLGLIGQLVSQMAKNAGALVLGIDLDESKFELAKLHGIHAVAHVLNDPVSEIALGCSHGIGLDVVIITASGNEEQTLQLAGQLCREKAKVVLLGAGDIQAPRNDYYHKELTVVVSRAFGPGSYDPAYIQGHDYPPGYSRWTVRRNMETFLDLIGRGQISLEGILSHQFPLEEAPAVYDMINQQTEKFVGIVFRYAEQISSSRVVTNPTSVKRSSLAKINVGFIGAGSFAQNYLIPYLGGLSAVHLLGVATATGISSKNTMRKFGFQYSSTDANEILKDTEINTVFIATRHNLHAQYVIDALKAGKHVFVEKPLAVNEQELIQIAEVLKHSSSQLMVGYNRRFAPLVQKLKDFFQHRQSPLVIQYRVNAGSIKNDHWIFSEEGGGRIIGEMCHFIDLFQFLTDAVPVEVSAYSSKPVHTELPIELDDNVSSIIRFSDGSTASLVYTSKGDLSYSRERLEVYSDGSIGVIDNFKKLQLVRKGKTQSSSLISREMGIRQEMEAYVKHLSTSSSQFLIPFAELYYTTLCTLKIIESLKTGQSQRLEIPATLTNNEV